MELLKGVVGIKFLGVAATLLLRGRAGAEAIREERNFDGK